MIDRVAFTLLGKPIYWYAIIITFGMIAGLLSVRQLFRRNKLDPDLVIDMALIVVPLSILFARAHYVIWSWEEFAGGPFWRVFAMWEGGMAIYGGLIGGFVGVVIFSRWKKIPLLSLCDMLVPGVALGQAIGRWGNFFNQEVYGHTVMNPSWQFFPASVFIDATQSWHLALFFYESVWNLLAFLALFFLISRKAKTAGIVFCSYFVIYGIARAALEPLREGLYIQNINGIPVNQLFAILLAAAGCVGIILLIQRAKKQPVPSPEEPFSSAQEQSNEELTAKVPVEAIVLEDTAVTETAEPVPEEAADTEESAPQMKE